jgi:hypothetical protein
MQDETLICAAQMFSTGCQAKDKLLESHQESRKFTSWRTVSFFIAWKGIIETTYVVVDKQVWAMAHSRVGRQGEILRVKDTHA